MKVFRFDFIFTAIFAFFDYVSTLSVILIFPFSWELEVNPILRFLGGDFGVIGVLILIPIIILIYYFLFLSLEKVQAFNVSLIIAIIFSSGHLLGIIFWNSAYIPLFLELTNFLRIGNNFLYLIFIFGACSIPLITFRELKMKKYSILE
jgi:hypothetical protein